MSVLIVVGTVIKKKKKKSPRKVICDAILVEMKKLLFVSLL